MCSAAHSAALPSKRKPCQGEPLAGFLVLLATETLVVDRGIVAAVRGSRSDTRHAYRNDRNRASRACGCATRAGSRSPGLRHRAACQRHQKSHCEELFHETPLKGHRNKWAQEHYHTRSGRGNPETSERVPSYGGRGKHPRDSRIPSLVGVWTGSPDPPGQRSPDGPAVRAFPLQFRWLLPYSRAPCGIQNSADEQGHLRA